MENALKQLLIGFCDQYNNTQLVNLLYNGGYFEILYFWADFNEFWYGWSWSTSETYGNMQSSVEWKPPWYKVNLFDYGGDIGNLYLWVDLAENLYVESRWASELFWSMLCGV